MNSELRLKKSSRGVTYGVAGRFVMLFLAQVVANRVMMPR